MAGLLRILNLLLAWNKLLKKEFENLLDDTWILLLNL